MQYQGNISSRFSGISEANALELLDNLKNMFPRYWLVNLAQMSGSYRNNSSSLKDLCIDFMLVFVVVVVVNKMSGLFKDHNL